MMNWNADTVVPGLVAAGVCGVVLHRVMGKLARRSGRVWPVRSTVAVAMLLPALFALSFVVPGILLQVQSLLAAAR